MKRFIGIICAVLLTASILPDHSSASASWFSDPSSGQPGINGSTLINPNPPKSPVKLIFIHHSVGQNWLDDGNGQLAIALKNNNYFVSDTNYGWGPQDSSLGGPIGSFTDIGHWWNWFRGPNSASYQKALMSESGKTFSYSRLAVDPGGLNKIVIFKSCFPNSSLAGNLSDPVPPIGSNPLRGQNASNQSAMTVANAKGIYIDLLNYFAAHQDTLYVVATAPPLINGTYASNARAFNNWLMIDWLSSYPYSNVAVFDLYDVLTTNGGGPNVNDLGKLTGNHHRYNSSKTSIEYINSQGGNTTAYPTSDDHPSQAGNQKATGELVRLLNIYYNRWKNIPLGANYQAYLPAIRK